MSEENPFDPELRGVPLTLTIDGPSLDGLGGQGLDEASFLLELGHSSALELLVLEPPAGLAEELPRAWLDDSDLDRDMRVIRWTGMEGFAGGVQPWSSRERLADEFEVPVPRRERWLWLDAVTWFSKQSPHQHFFVTTDPQLLSWIQRGEYRRYWQRREIISVRQALRFADWAMLAQRKLVVEAAPRYTRTTSRFSMHARLAIWLVPARARLSHAARTREPTDAGGHSLLLGMGDLGELEQSMLSRIMDLLRARDGVALQWLRHQNNATLEETLFFLRSCVTSAAGLFDALASFALRVLEIDPGSIKGGAGRVTLRSADFRKRLADEGAKALAQSAQQQGALWRALGEVRNPIVHGPGISGMRFQRVPGAQESRVVLRPAQAQAFEQLARVHGGRAESWGLEPPSLGAIAVEPLSFSEKLIDVVLATAQELMDALADDLGVPAADLRASADERSVVERYALLCGFAEALHRPRDTVWQE